MSASSASLRHAHSSSKAPPPVSPWDCRTWPRTMSANEIKGLLKAYVKPDAKVDYEGLEFFLTKQKFESIERLLHGQLYEPKPNKIDVEKLLSRHVNNTQTSMSMKLVDRDLFLNNLKSLLLSSPKPSDKQMLAYTYAMRGSGKTQVLKYAVHEVLLERAQRGRVIVRCCDKSASTPWIAEALAGRSERALCELIAEHLREVVGPTNVAATPEEAYAEWRRRTKEHFGMDDATSLCMEPIIMLDTCEILANVEPIKTKVHSSCDRLYNALELLATAVPKPNRMVAIGCNATVAHDGVYVTQCNVVALPTLTPIRREHHAEAVSAWGEKIDASVQDIVYLLTGGLPRLLRQAHAVTFNITLASGAVGALATCFDNFVFRCNAYYTITRFDVAYCCYLASITRWPVRDVNAAVPMPPGSAGEGTTFRQAVETSIGMYDPAAEVFVMPPVFGKQLSGFGIPGVALPRPEDVCPLDIVADLASGGALARGVPFERAFLHALHARYLLCRWSQKSADGWVKLADVLQGALSDADSKRIAALEVNLAGGVCDENAESYDSFSALSSGQARTIQWNTENHKALHDGYIRCRRGSSGPLVTVPIQIRHGTPKTPDQLEPQLWRSRGEDKTEIEDVLLSVCNNKTAADSKSERIVHVHGDAMVFSRHLYIATRAQAPAATDEEPNAKSQTCAP